MLTRRGHKWFLMALGMAGKLGRHHPRAIRGYDPGAEVQPGPRFHRHDRAPAVARAPVALRARDCGPLVPAGFGAPSLMGDALWRRSEVHHLTVNGAAWVGR